MDFFIHIKPIVVVLHALGAAVGLGAVVVTDTLFFKFLNDFKISNKEDQVLRVLSRIVWGAIIVLVLTGIALFLSNPALYMTSSKFITKLVILGVIIINGIFLNTIITPVIKKIVFGPLLKDHSVKLRVMRHFAFAGGVISILSWVIVFILGSIRSIPYSFDQAILVYAVVCLGGILASQLYAFWFKHHHLFPGK